MRFNNTEVIVEQGDITGSDCQAIVNAANNKFLMGGGVAGAIKRKGGQAIETEAIKQGPKQVGDSVITKAGDLKAKYVIHAATMTMNFKTDSDIIRKATYSALLLAQENNISSIAFCALGCGVGGFSYQAAAKIMAQEVFHYLREIKGPTLKKIVFLLNSKEAFNIFEKNAIGYIKHMHEKISQGPFVTVDGIVEYEQGIVLIERSNPPFGWALPGGFVDYGESVETAVVREVKEETSLDLIGSRQFKTYSDPGRDPRFHTVSVVFIGQGKGKLAAASDAKGAKVFSLDDLPQTIAFDHKKIIEQYINGK